MAASAWEQNIYIPAVRSGETAVTTAGTAVALGSGEIHGPIAIKALAANTGIMYVGYVAGDVANDSGFELSAKEVVIINHIVNLADLMVDSSVNGEGVCWIALNV